VLDLQRLYKVREYCDTFNQLVIMSFNAQNPEAAALAMHPAALVRVPDASLPHPLQDPNPALTLALHHLWASLRRFCTISGDRGRFHAPGEAPNLKIADALLEIRDPFVSSCSSRAKFSTNDHIYQLAYDNILGRTQMESQVGYRVRLWLVVFAESCISRPDRRAIAEFDLPPVMASEVMAVSSLLHIFLFFFHVNSSSCFKEHLISPEERFLGNVRACPVPLPRFGPHPSYERVPSQPGKPLSILVSVFVHFN